MYQLPNFLPLFHSRPPDQPCLSLKRNQINTQRPTWSQTSPVVSSPPSTTVTNIKLALAALNRSIPNGRHTEQMSSLAFSHTLTTLCEHCLFVLLRHIYSLEGAEDWRKRGVRTECDGGEKMARKWGKRWVPRCCTTTPSLSNRQNYHSGQKHINKDPIPWTSRIQLSATPIPSSTYPHITLKL